MKKTHIRSETAFRKKVVASAVASVFATSFTPFAQAEDDLVEENAQDQAEVVVVTGIRGSLQKSMDDKRDAKGVVDAINAEDMGKFPDTNLAESLQRITGVSINRRNGEGNQVTVRGFGPDYNLVTLNGRLMPSTSLNQNGGGVSQGRAFEMDNLASESVRALEVYKTGRADIASGGVGATINIKTMRPLENPGLHATLGGKLLHDTTTYEGDDYTPEVNGMFSWTNNANKFGVSLTASMQKRESAASGAYINGWNTAAYDGTIPQSADGAAIGDPLNIINEPQQGELRSLFTDLRYTHSDRERTRTNSQLTLQWRPSDNITGTVDYTYAKQDIYENRSELSAWMDSYKSDIAFDNSTPHTPVLYWEERRELNPRDIGLALQQQNQVNELKSIGFNVEWLVNDKLSFTFDGHHSESSSLPDAGYGNWINIGLGALVSRGQGVDFTNNGIPILMLDFDDSLGNDNGQLDVSEIGSAVRQISNDRANSDFKQYRVDGNFILNDVSSIDFGIESRDMEMTLQSSFYQQELEGGWGIGNPGDVPAEFLEPINYAGFFHGYNLTPRGAAGTFFDGVSGGSATPLLRGYTGDAAVVGRHLSNAIGLPWSVNPVDNLDRTITEKITAAYFQYTFEGELKSKPITVLAGVRYEKTEVTSTDLVKIPEHIVWQSDNDFQVPEGSTGTMYAKDADYDHVLPNISIDIEVSDEVKARAAYSRTIGRARYDQMGSAETGLGGPSLPTILQGSQLGRASSGDPGILPLESDNFDVSVEWYFGESSYASIGYFRKDVKNFIGIGSVDKNLYGLTDPTNGPRVQQAIADLQAAGIPLTDVTLFAMVLSTELGLPYDTYSNPELWGAHTDGQGNPVDVLSNDNDELATFRVTVPENNEDASIDGWELAFQHFFGDTGFGLQANYTLADGDARYDNKLDPQINGGAQFALTGLSDTANVSLIYEDHGIAARLTYNWRDQFLAGIENGGTTPRYVEDYQQYDLSVTYEVTEQFKVGLEGINLLGEDERQHARTDEQLLRIEMLGPRYAVTARYNF